MFTKGIWASFHHTTLVNHLNRYAILIDFGQQINLCQTFSTSESPTLRESCSAQHESHGARNVTQLTFERDIKHG